MIYWAAQTPSMPDSYTIPDTAAKAAADSSYSRFPGYVAAEEYSVRQSSTHKAS